MSPRLLLTALSGSLLLINTAQAQSKADKAVIKQLKADIGYLASDELEGRRVGSEGEKKAADYIEQRYKAMGIPGYNGQYRYPFQYIDGKQINQITSIKLGNSVLKIKDEAFPLAFSANKRAYSEILPDVLEQGNIWMMPIYKDSAEAEDVHFDWEKAAFEKASEAQKQGATGVLFYDSYNAKFTPEYNAKSEYETLDIPVAMLTYKAYSQRIHELRNEGSNERNGAPVELNVSLKRTELTGHNVAAFIDSKAPLTVVLGAHYDHLGYGHDGNSLDAKKTYEVHNGADDNASGSAALLQLAEWVKKNKLNHYNYLFINFSGEEEGLIGSKAIVKDQKLDSNKIAYMINMDMVGRLNDSTHALTVGGIGTSPSWGQFTKNNKFKIAVDSAGVGPSDHTSFYYAGVPVLFVFTGLHTDYHKPTDDANKINYAGEAQVMHYVYDVVAKMDAQPKPEYRTTKQSTVGKVRFKVTLGIMPDYSFQEGGVRVDGVTDGRPAVKAGIKGGDIITQLGTHKVNGMQTYMEALGAFKEGDSTSVTIQRDGKELILPIEFK
ncbi:MAG: M28 family peptidase [Sphingobacteriales bacterium]|nr:MAG: M28 family peptidase [Sphingobacteriales bacterium]